MSEFHGGFFIENVDGKILEPIRRAMRDYLFRKTKLGHKYVIAFAARRGAPVMHVAVRNEDADGKGYATFHQRHQALGAEIARAIGATVHAYHYENQSGSEGVTTFDARGTEIASTHASWDELAGREGLDDEGRAAELFAALPLGQLAARLGVERSMLDEILPYDTPTLRVKLVGDVPRIALTEYLESSPRAPGGDPPGWPQQALYFPEPWVREIDALATRLDVPVGVLLNEAFEAAKPDLYAIPAPEDADGNVPSALPIPDRDAPSVLDVSQSGAPLRELASGEKVGVKLALPSDVWPHLRELATHLDRSLSWLLQRAWRISRERLHAARRAP